MAQAQQPRVINFDVPGAGTGPYQGTIGVSINSKGTISGYFADTNYLFHGFLRGSDGKFTTFEVPGATGTGTFPVSMNDEGWTVGYYNDANNAFHGFLRKSDGEILTFTDENECTGGDYQGCQGTGFHAINDLGIISGSYLDVNYVHHSYLRSPDGTITPFQAPDAGNMPDSDPTNYFFQGTGTVTGSGIDIWGTILGYHVDTNYVNHGYLRSPNGTIAEFDAPNADTTTAGYGTSPASLNNFGAITGEFLDANSVYHGFLRDAHGRFQTFDAPGADTTPGSFNGTFPANINDLGVITGYFLDANGVSHGFVRDQESSITTFDVPGADETPGDYGGTFPSSNNMAGEVIGYYQDANNVYHGFILKP